MASDPHIVDSIVPTPKPVLRVPATLFKPEEVQSAISPKIFIAKEASLYSSA